MTRHNQCRFDSKRFLAEVGAGRTAAAFDGGGAIFTQGEVANELFYIQQGGVKLTVVSRCGKEAVIALLGAGDFFGEGCLAGQPLRMATATALTECSIMRLEKAVVVKMLYQEPVFSKRLLSYLLARTIRIEEDLLDQLFNSSEKRLARTLLLLANFGKDDESERVIPKISHEMLAKMIGTTRSRVSFFMNKFRQLGFIQYNGFLEVHRSLLNFILHDQ
jgi:CRP/FNR family transcriptional regulator, cyclic AMP receptor protein